MTASSCTLVFCLVLGCAYANTFQATVGQDVTLTCKYDAAYYGNLGVCWGRGSIPNRGCDREVIRTDGTAITIRLSQRYGLLGDMGNGDVSLTIRHVEESDSGMYGCRVDIPGWFNDHKHEVILRVTPARPNPLTVEPREVNEESITVRWGHVFNGGRPVTSFRVDLKNKQAHWNTAIRKDLHDPQLTQVTLVDLRPAKTYNVRMFAFNSVGMSESSNVLTVTTKEAAPEGPPLDMQLEALSSHSIKVTWKAPRSDLRNGVLRSYKISYRENDPVDRQLRPWQHTSVNAGWESQSHVLTSLKPSTKYGVLIQARTNAGIGPASTAPLCSTLDEDQTSTPPTVSTTSPTATEWTDTTSVEPTKTTKTVTLETTSVEPTKTTKRTLETTSASATVWEATSPTFILSTPEQPLLGFPDPPVIELKDVKDGVISLLWTPGFQGDSPVSEYRLEYKAVNASWDHRKTVHFSPNQTEATIIEIKPSTYNIQMFARNTFGSSKASNVLTLTVEEKGPHQDVPATTLATDAHAVQSAEESRSAHFAAILVPVLLALAIVAIVGPWQLRRIQKKKGSLNMWPRNGVLRYRGAGSLQESL